MDKDQIAQQMFGKSYAELSVYDQYRVDKEAKSPAEAKPPAINSLRGPDGVVHDYGWNPQTQQFDIDYGPTSAAPREATGGTAAPRPQGGLNEQALIDAGATKLGPGIYGYNGQEYRIQPDGTYSPYGSRTTTATTQRLNPITQAALSVQQTQQALRGVPEADLARASDRPVGASSLGDSGTPVGESPRVRATAFGGDPTITDPNPQPFTTARIPTTDKFGNYGAGFYDKPINTSNLAQDLALVGLRPQGNPEREAQVALGLAAKIGSMRANGMGTAEISNFLDFHRQQNERRSQAMAKEGPLTASDLAAMTQPVSLPRDENYFDPGVLRSYGVLTPEEEQRRIDELAAQGGTMGMAEGGSLYTGSPDDLSSDRNSAIIQPFVDTGFPTNYKVNGRDTYGPGYSIAMRRWQGLYQRPNSYYEDPPGGIRPGGAGTPPPPGPLMPGYHMTDSGPVQGNHFGYTPRRFDDGGVMAINEPMSVYGDYSGQKVATMGEPNALTGGQPTREVMNVQPLEPSVPMGQAAPSAPPTNQPTDKDIAVLAGVVNMMMGRRKKGGYSPAPLGS